MLCKHEVIGSSPIISKNTTLQAGFEPATRWLTATRSATELLKNQNLHRGLVSSMKEKYSRLLPPRYGKEFPWEVSSVHDNIYSW